MNIPGVISLIASREHWHFSQDMTFTDWTMTGRFTGYLLSNVGL